MGAKYVNPNIKLGSLDTVKNLSLFSLTGQLVYESSNQNKIDISEFNSGIYILKVNTEKGSFTKKVLKR